MSVYGSDSSLGIPPEDIEFVDRLTLLASRNGAAKRRKTTQAPDATRCKIEGSSHLENVVQRITMQPAPLQLDRDAGPRAVQEQMANRFLCNREREAWIENARIAALLGACPKSLNSFRSGVRCYLNFAETVLKVRGSVLPPTLAALLSWSQMFRCADTFSNYLSHVKLACELIDVSTSVFSERSLWRAKTAILKRGDFRPRKKMFIRLELVKRIVKIGESCPSEKAFAMLYLISYVFLLRLPSEALPITVVQDCRLAKEKSAVSVHHDKIGFRFASRKNRLWESYQWRSCWCSQDRSTCPVHVLGPFLLQYGFGGRPFVATNEKMALSHLRTMLMELRVEEAHLYRTHDLRRGHTQDLVDSGTPAVEVLRLGDWRSRAVHSYVDMDQLENMAVAGAHFMESSDSEDDER